MFKAFIDHLQRIDWLLVFAAAVLVTFGLFGLSSLAKNGVIAYAFVWKQAAYGLGGISGALFISQFNSRIFQKHGTVTLILYVLGLAGLLGLFIFGESIRGTRAWYRLGSFSLAPVEFVKIAFLLLLAKFFSDRHRNLYTVHHIFISLLYLGILIVPVLLQPDLGSAIVLIAVWLGVTLFTGIRFRWVVVLVLAAAVSVGVAWQYGLKSYQKDRILVFLHPARQLQGFGYHTLPSKIAMGSGGQWGKGYGAGTQGGRKFLPEASTDFIFAVIAEERGGMGILALLFFFGLLWYRVLNLGKAAGHNFERIFTFGFAWLIAIHFFINVGMNTGLLPVIGLPLPFVSYGGSHMLAGFMGLGILLSISAQRQKVPPYHGP